MSHQKDLLREIAAATSSGGPDRISDWFTEEFRLHEPGAPALPAGHEGARQMLAPFEQRADLPPCALGDDERARLGHRLQAGSEVRGLADNPALLCGARADQVADHDQPAGDAEPNIWKLARSAAPRPRRVIPETQGNRRSSSTPAGLCRRRPPAIFPPHKNRADHPQALFASRAGSDCA
jgi:hypothetical protein